MSIYEHVYMHGKEVHVPLCKVHKHCILKICIDRYIHRVRFKLITFE